jgi:hypothetical protein
VNTLERKSIDIKGIVWLKRLVMVTEEVLYFATPDEARNVIDFILVKDLVECDCVQDDELAQNGMMEVVFRTKKESRNCGRSYIFRTSEEDARGWENVMDPCFERAHKRENENYLTETYGHSCFELTRAKCSLLIKSPSWQYLSAASIMVGFLSEVLQAQILAEDGSSKASFFTLDCAVTGYFAMELSVRLFALSSNWFRLFYTDPGNAFDALIVSLSVASLYLQEAGQQAHPIKMLRFVKVLTCLKANPKILKLCAPLLRLVKSIGDDDVVFIQRIQ